MIPTIEDGNNVTDTITAIVRRVRKPFDESLALGAGGWSPERLRGLLLAVMTDREMRLLMMDADAREAMLFAFVKHLISQDFADNLFVAGAADVAAATAPR